MSARPASFNAATMFDPIKPAPPVTSNITCPALIVGRQLCLSPARQATWVTRSLKTPAFRQPALPTRDRSLPTRLIAGATKQMNTNSIQEMKEEDPDETSPILIVPYMWIGDFVRGHTVVRVLKQRWPNRPIDL